MNDCTGARLTAVTFVSAAHCMEKATNDESINVYASNSRLFSAPLRNIKAHLSWTNIDGGVIISGSDAN